MIFDDFASIPKRFAQSFDQSTQQQQLFQLQRLQEIENIQYKRILQEKTHKWYGQTSLVCEPQNPISISTQEQRVLDFCSQVEDGKYVYGPKDWCHCLYADYCETKADNPFYKEDKVWQVDQAKLDDPKVLSYYQSPFPYNLNTYDIDPSYDPRCRAWF